MTDFEQLSVFNLASGAHEYASQGLCAMEAVAWLEGLEHSDRPHCTCPIVGAFVRPFNDSLPDDQRQRLIPYLPRLVGTVSKDDEQARAQYLVWQAIRVFAPLALDAVGLFDQAEKLREFKGTLMEARDAAYAAARAADAAAYAAARAADAKKVTYDAGFACLDGLLKIGKQAEPFTRDTNEAVSAYRDLISA